MFDQVEKVETGIVQGVGSGGFSPPPPPPPLFGSIKKINEKVGKFFSFRVSLVLSFPQLDLNFMWTK